MGSSFVKESPCYLLASSSLGGQREWPFRLRASRGRQVPMQSFLFLPAFCLCTVAASRQRSEDAYLPGCPQLPTSRTAPSCPQLYPFHRACSEPRETAVPQLPMLLPYPSPYEEIKRFLSLDIFYFKILQTKIRLSFLDRHYFSSPLKQKPHMSPAQ